MSPDNVIRVYPRPRARGRTDGQIPLVDRVTAALILLYAQPISRIVNACTPCLVRR